MERQREKEREREREREGGRQSQRERQMTQVCKEAKTKHRSLVAGVGVGARLHACQDATPELR